MSAPRQKTKLFRDKPEFHNPPPTTTTTTTHHHHHHHHHHQSLLAGLYGLCVLVRHYMLYFICSLYGPLPMPNAKRQTIPCCFTDQVVQ